VHAAMDYMIGCCVLGEDWNPVVGLDVASLIMVTCGILVSQKKEPDSLNVMNIGDRIVDNLLLLWRGC
jgi:hypothetical protein